MPAPSATPPEATLRLFPGLDAEEITLDGAPYGASQFVIGRLLEEGDRDDLRWLCGAVEEPTLVEWMAARAGRQLSRRSRAFWTLLLGGPASETDDNPLWPL